jgi:4'-phosphopantetheinyl transferase
VWCARLDVPHETFARLGETLGADERGRSARFRFPRDRWQFIVAHGALRDLLGRYLEVEPDRIEYRYGAFGKPELGPEFGGRLRFSLSHSGGLALVAIAAGSDVGVDVESSRSHPDSLELARSCFSETEFERLSAFPETFRAEAFLGCWTKKEACVKARGRGLSIPLSSFTVPVTTDPAHGPATIAWKEDGRATLWSVHTLRPAPGYIGAVAIQGSGGRVSQWEWTMQAA